MACLAEAAENLRMKQLVFQHAHLLVWSPCAFDSTIAAGAARKGARRDSGVHESPFGTRSSERWELQTTVAHGLLVEVRHDLGIGDVGLVVPVKAGVDVRILGDTLDGLDRGNHALLADADRVLRDGAEFVASVDGVDLSLAGVVAGDEDLAAALASFLGALNGALGAAFVRA